MNKLQQKAQVLSKLVSVFKLENTTVSSAYHFVVNGKPVGVIRDKEWAVLSKHAADIFKLNGRIIELNKWKTADEITLNMEKLLVEFRKRNLFICLQGWRNEKYDVAQKYGDEPVFAVERAATYIFGIKRYGVHINGYSRDPVSGKRFVWLQKRSLAKDQYPGKLDCMVSGGLETGSTIENCMIKEAFEEASIPEHLIRQWAKHVGHVSFMFENEKGIYPETLYCYDAELPFDFEPTGNDGEVDEFSKIPIDDLLELLFDQDRFKLTSVPVVLDFLVRHHVLDSGYGDGYFDTMDTIHQPLFRNYPPNDFR